MPSSRSRIDVHASLSCAAGLELRRSLDEAHVSLHRAGRHRHVRGRWSAGRDPCVRRHLEAPDDRAAPRAPDRVRRRSSLHVRGLAQRTLARPAPIPSFPAGRMPAACRYPRWTPSSPRAVARAFGSHGGTRIMHERAPGIVSDLVGSSHRSRRGCALPVDGALGLIASHREMIATDNLLTVNKGKRWRSSSRTAPPESPTQQHRWIDDGDRPRHVPKNSLGQAPPNLLRTKTLGPCRRWPSACLPERPSCYSSPYSARSSAVTSAKPGTARAGSPARGGCRPSWSRRGPSRSARGSGSARRS
jgi:hypothetical protein